MRALSLDSYGGTLQVVELPMPSPGPGEVVVRVCAAPVNPSDMAFLQGNYGIRKKLPVIPGFEGSGVVVATGRDAIALDGARVALTASGENGTWADYVVTRARSCARLEDGTDLEAAASSIINPITAWALLDVAAAGHHPAAVQTAAASSLGKMVSRLAKRRGYPMVHVVRRAGQRAELEALGAEHVLDSTQVDFDDRLTVLARELGATVAFDAVAGALSGRVLRALPRGGRAVVYGALSGEPARADVLDLVFGGKRLEGFWLSEWMRARGADEVGRAHAVVQERLADDFRTEIATRVTLDDAPRAIGAGATGGKILIVSA